MTKEKVKKVMSSLLGIFLTVLFVIGIIMFAMILISRGNNAPRVMGYSVMYVRSGSMEPAIKKSDMILVKKVPSNTIKEGDIISFISDNPEILGSINTHRVEKIEKNKSDGSIIFTTKGDANDKADIYPVQESKLIGKVVEELGFIGKFFKLFQNRYVIFFSLVLPMAIILLYELFNIAKIQSERKRESEVESEKIEDKPTDK